MSFTARLVAALVAAAGCGLTFFSLFLLTGRATDAPSAMAIVLEGVAGRYFIPFALPALLSLSVPLGSRRGASFGILVCLVAALVNTVALAEIAGHYYTTERITIDTAVYDLKSTAVVPLTAGSRLEQTLTPRFNKLARIDFDVALYGRRIPTGQLVVTVYASTGEPLASERLPLREMRDGSPLAVRFHETLDAKHAPLRLELSLDSAPPESVLGFYATAGARDLYPDGVLAVDGRPVPQQDLTFRAYRRGRNDSVVPQLKPGIASGDERRMPNEDAEDP